MNLDELQSVRDRERQTDKPQQLRESFYADVGSFVEQLRAERDRAAERHGSPYADEVMRLTDEIDAAQQLVEDIHERRIGKVVKAASLEAAALSPEVDGLTTEEQALFDDLVADIEHHREDVLTTVEAEEPTDTGATADHGQTNREATGIDVADVMGTDTAGEGAPPSPESTDPGSEHPDPGEMPPDTAPGDRPGGSDPPASGPARTDGNGSRPDEPPADGQGHRPTDPTRNGHAETEQSSQVDPTRNGHAETEQSSHSDTARNGHADAVQNGQTEASRGGHGGAESTEQGGGSGGVGGRAERAESGVSTGPGEGQSETDGSVETTGAGADTETERERVLVTRDVDTFVGSDARDYDLVADDVVTLPATNAEILVQQDAARRL